MLTYDAVSDYLLRMSLLEKTAARGGARARERAKKKARNFGKHNFATAEPVVAAPAAPAVPSKAPYVPDPSKIGGGGTPGNVVNGKFIPSANIYSNASTPYGAGMGAYGAAPINPDPYQKATKTMNNKVNGLFSNGTPGGNFGRSGGNLPAVTPRGDVVAVNGAKAGKFFTGKRLAMGAAGLGALGLGAYLYNKNND